MCVCAGAAFALSEAAGTSSGPGHARIGEAAEAKGESGESGGQAEEDPCHEGASGLQQADQRKPVYDHNTSLKHK